MEIQEVRIAQPQSAHNKSNCSIGKKIIGGFLYLEAVQWTEEEEEKLRELLARINIDDPKTSDIKYQFPFIIRSSQTKSSMGETDEPTTTPIVEEPSRAELLGSNNWEGLLHPLNLSLRRLILLSGDFCQCTYDSFNGDKFSKYAGTCRYSKESFFHDVKFEAAADYQVSTFLYATSSFVGGLISSRQTNFIGYIATTTDAVAAASGRRDIHVVWRGTQTELEWFNVAQFNSVSAADLLNPRRGSGEVRVMNGWLKIYASANPDAGRISAREQLHRKLQQLLEEYRHEHVSIVVSGHSLGAALGVLSAFDIAENVVDDDGSVPVAAIVFGSPQVGDGGFIERVQQLRHLKILHVKNKLDPFVLYPGLIDSSYKDAGIKLEVDSRRSPFLKMIPDTVSDWHNLQALLHVVAGWNGDDEKFELKVKRSHALVNKSCGFLRDESIPSSWWVVENKGMVLDEHGEWALAPPPDEELDFS